MAKTFLTNLDLSGNQLLNATFEKLASDPGSNLFDGRMYYNTASAIVRVYDSTASAWVGLGAVKNILGTANEVTVSIDEAEVATISLPDTIHVDVQGDLTGNVLGNVTGSVSGNVTGDLTGKADTADKLHTPRTITLAGDLTGSASFDGSENITITASVESESSVNSITGTANQIDVSASVGDVTLSLPETIHRNLQGNVTGDLTGNADTASALETSRTINLSGDVSGSVTFDGSASVDIVTTIQPDSVALGTDTTGNYVTQVTGSGAGISVTGTGESASVVVENTGVTSIAGTANEIDVSASTGSVTVGLPNDVTVGNNLTVDNDLVVQNNFTVNGTTTFINTQDLNVKDNIITLNYGLAASVLPTLNAGIDVARGASANVELRWNESLDTWQATRTDASDNESFRDILLEGDAIPVNVITDFSEEVEDVVGNMVQGTSTINVTYSDNGASAGILTIDTVEQASNSYLLSASGLAVDVASLETKLVTDSFTRKATGNLGNGAATSFVVTHGLATRDVVVHVYRNGTPYDQVEVDVLHYDASDAENTNKVTIAFASAPTTNEYRVVIVG
jgi:hypothetical protein